jgi:hypothetical protein
MNSSGSGRSIHPSHTRYQSTGLLPPQSTPAPFGIRCLCVVCVGARASSQTPDALWYVWYGNTTAAAGRCRCCPAAPINQQLQGTVISTAAGRRPATPQHNCSRCLIIHDQALAPSQLMHDELLLVCNVC